MKTKVCILTVFALISGVAFAQYRNPYYPYYRFPVPFTTPQQGHLLRNFVSSSKGYSQMGYGHGGLDVQKIGNMYDVVASRTIMDEKPSVVGYAVYGN